MKDKTILVTGAGRGIGNALCKQLYKLGAKVIAVSKELEGLQDLQNECPSTKIIQVDLSKWNETRERLQNVENLDGLVNNAGIAIIKPFEELTEKEFDDTFDVNVKALFNVTQILLPKLNSNSSVVNLASLASSRSFGGHSVYSATKAAVDSLTRSFAFELSHRKIRFNSVNPTVILTQMGRENWSDPKKADPLLNHIPMRRFGEVHEVTNAIIFLLGDESSFVNGTHMLLEGGYSVS